MFLGEFLETYFNHLHLTSLSVNPSLPLNFINRHTKELIWWHLINNSAIDEAFITANLDRVIWDDYTFKNSNLSLEFMEKHRRKIPSQDFFWDQVSSSPNITEEFIDKHLNKVKWERLFSNPALTLPLIKKYYKYCDDVVKWNCLSLNPNLDISFIEENSSKLNWSCITNSSCITEEFIEKNLSKIGLIMFSTNPNLDISFVEKHLDKFNLHDLSRCFLSEDFFNKYSHRLIKNIFYSTIPSEFIKNKILDQSHWNWISKNPNFNFRFFEKKFSVINWHNFSLNSNIPVKFFLKHCNKINFTSLSSNHFTRQKYLEDKIFTLQSLKIDF